MAKKDGFDGSGTVWVHDSPVGAPERDEAPEPAPAAAPPGAPARPVHHPPPPMAPMVQEAPRSGMGSTGCLVGLFALGGVGLGLAVLMAIAAVGVAYWMRAGM
jgi:hypothetical protein